MKRAIKKPSHDVSHDMAEGVAQLCATMAVWREECAERYPRDLRNAAAAQRLWQFRQELLEDPDIGLCERLSSALDATPRVYTGAERDPISEHLRLVEFYAFPESANELLRWIIGNLERWGGTQA